MIEMALGSTARGGFVNVPFWAHPAPVSPRCVRLRVVFFHRVATLIALGTTRHFLLSSGRFGYELVRLGILIQSGGSVAWGGAKQTPSCPGVVQGHRSASLSPEHSSYFIDEEAEAQRDCGIRVQPSA